MIPEKELKAFAKTRLLQPGESEMLKMSADRRDLASFNEQSGKWVIAKGNYRFAIAASSADIRTTINKSIK